MLSAILANKRKEANCFLSISSCHMCPLKMRFGETGCAESSTVSKCAVDFLKAEPRLIHFQQQSIGILRLLYPGRGCWVSSVFTWAFNIWLRQRWLHCCIQKQVGMEERSPC